MNPIYNLRTLAPGHFAIGKFSMPDFNVEAVYNLHAKGTGYTCDCPAGQRSVKLKPCKHQRMIRFMMGAVNTDRFYDPETGNWMQPMAPELHEITREGEATIQKLAEDLLKSNGHEPPQATSAAQAPGAASPTTTPRPPAPTGAPIVTRRI